MLQRQNFIEKAEAGSRHFSAMPTPMTTFGAEKLEQHNKHFI